MKEDGWHIQSNINTTKYTRLSQGQTEMFVSGEGAGDFCHSRALPQAGWFLFELTMNKGHHHLDSLRFSIFLIFCLAYIHIRFKHAVLDIYLS